MTASYEIKRHFSPGFVVSISQILWVTRMSWVEYASCRLKECCVESVPFQHHLVEFRCLNHQQNSATSTSRTMIVLVIYVRIVYFLTSVTVVVRIMLTVVTHLLLIHNFSDCYWAQRATSDISSFGRQATGDWLADPWRHSRPYAERIRQSQSYRTRAIPSIWWAVSGKHG